ncbi:MAG TPA: thiamine diphosphokinase [Anaerolineales bacterium]
MTALVVANGSPPSAACARRWHQQADLLVAADGGLEHCLAWGLTPDLLIGDLDSVGGEAMEALRRAGGQVQEHPPRKDANDLELALLAVAEAGHKQVIILAGVGGRWDQSLASFLLLANERFAGLQIALADDRQWATLVRPGRSLELPGELGHTVSLLPLGASASGITTKGLAYPLDQGELSLGSSRGISNVIHALPATVTIQQGLLLCLVDQAADGPLAPRGG